MDQRKRIVPIWVGVLYLVLAGVGIVWSVFSMFTYVSVSGSVIGVRICQSLAILSLAFAVGYCLKGYQKNSAIYYKLFVYFYTAQRFVAGILARTDVLIFPVTDFLSYGVLSILGVARDLGKKKSYILCGINVALSLVRVGDCIVSGRPFSGAMFSNLVLACILCIMTYAKYTDKTARGTK